MLGYNLTKLCQENCYIYFIAVILIPKTRQKLGELGIAIIAVAKGQRPRRLTFNSRIKLIAELFNFYYVA